MPYVHCPRCRLTVYSAARRFVRESCPRCDTALDARPRSLFGLPSHESNGSRPAEHAAEATRGALVGGTGRFRPSAPLQSGEGSRADVAS